MATVTKSKRENDQQVVLAIEDMLTEGILSTIPLVRQSDIIRALTRECVPVTYFDSQYGLDRCNRRMGAYLSRVSPSILYDAYRERDLSKFLQIQTICPWTGQYTYTKVYGNLNVMPYLYYDKVFARRSILTQKLSESLEELYKIMGETEESKPRAIGNK